ncbi:MAG: hypothetical protein L3J79_01655 [Candidatus Marinimicrobia bacterium]|nr:hypothetical protein [Candidatus Neomarinimicrobiota bacterium]
MKSLVRISIFTRPIILLALLSLLHAGGSTVGEEAELVSYAQDVYRQQGVNMARSAFELDEQDTWGRVFLIRLVSRSTTLSTDLLQAFLIGGAVSQHARSPMDQVVVTVEVEFSHRQDMILSADGKCCEKLYNNRMTPEMFTKTCLRMK